MSQALYTAMGGISAAQTALNVTSNNVANINTTAFKASSTRFSDVFSTTISSGSVSTQSTGGTNPIQVGVGVKVSAVTKDFKPGSWMATGSSTDLMIQGGGFFTVQSSDGQNYYTRAGDFSFDENGSLVTSSGYKVLGTNSILSTTSSLKPVFTPKSIVAKPVGNTDVGNQQVANLNNGKITSGNFTITNGATSYPVSIAITGTTTMNDLASQIQSDIGTPAATGITVSCADGKISFSVVPSTANLTFSSPASGASNFLTETGIGTVTKAISGSSGVYASKVLDYTVDVTQVTNASTAVSISSSTINDDGSIQATYSNGDTLSVQLAEDGATYEFLYTTSAGVEISGANCRVDTNVAEPANFVIQLAGITNPDGLISVGSNLFKAGPNSGDIFYSVGNKMGLGSLEAGGLEASNVDLSAEFSDMILSQRAVQANSRVFSTTSDIMDTIVNMAR